MHHIALGEFIGEQVSDVSGEEIGKRLQFESGHGTFARLNLHNGGARHAEFVRDFVLRHRTRIPCLPGAAAQLDLINRHVSP
jgi:hypothetical protein